MRNAIVISHRYFSSILLKSDGREGVRNIVEVRFIAVVTEAHDLPLADVNL